MVGGLSQMKSCVSILFIFALSAPPFTSVQDKASNDLNTLLRDASYVLIGSKKCLLE
jgi:hypothetical protein